MSSIKSSNSKFNLINDRVKYGTDGGINVDSGTLAVNPITMRVGVNTLTPTSTFDISGSIKSTSIVDYNNSTGNNSQVLEKANNQNLWSYLDYNFSGSDMFPENTGDVLGPPIPVTSGFWSGVCCLGPDGLIYASPRSGNSVYVFNPYNNTLDLTTYANATGDFVGCCTGPNGKIYFAPGSSSFVGIIDPVRKSWDNTTISSTRYPNLATTTTNGKFWRCTLAPNGRIFMAARSATWIGVVDTNNDTYTSIDISNITGAALNGLNYIGSANAKNGFLYMFPYNNAYPILKINPTDLSYTQIPQVFPFTRYNGVVTGPDGNAYGLPGPDNGTPQIRRVDTNGDVFVNSPTLNNASTFFPRGISGAVLSLQGEIWFPPNAYDTSTPQHLGKYNVSTNTFTYYNIPSAQRNQILRRVGAVLAPNGKLYFMPNFRDGSIPDQRVFAFKTGIPTQDAWMMAPEFNQSG